MVHPLVALAALALAVACSPSARAPEWARVLETTPAFLRGTNAYDPSLAAGPGGRLALTWVTRDSTGADAWLALSADSGGAFGTPLRLNERRGQVESYPESRPVAAFGPAGRVLVAWTRAREGEPAAADVVVRASVDGGATLGREVVVNDDHADPASRYHGFVSIEFTPGGRALAVWIDGRETRLRPDQDEPDVAAIWCSVSDDGGWTWRKNARAAGGVCPCCRPSLRADDGGRVAIAYRGVRDNVRDPRLAISEDGGATFALDTLVSRDGWSLPGCPSSGPALTMERGGGAIAWFTDGPAGGGGRGPGIYAASWRASAGAGAAVALGDSVLEPAHPILTSAGALALVGVLARAGADRSRRVLAVRALPGADTPSPWLYLGTSARTAALVATDARHASAAWTEQADGGPRLHLARLTLLGPLARAAAGGS
jgi:hypothetical protein